MKIPQSARQIAEALEKDIVLISHNLKKLIKFKEVKYIELKWYKATEVLGWRTTRRTSFYFLPNIKSPLDLLQKAL